jgi:hypothetical protein
MAQEIYHRSEWGNPNEQWGNVYLNADLTNELYKRASEYENSWVTDQLLNGVGIKPSIILTPTAYEDGVLNSVKPQKTYGSELVTNGEFSTDSDWTKGSGWSISNGKAISNNSTSSIYQSTGSNYTSGKTYKIVFTVSDYVSGSVRPEITNVIGSNVSSNGTFTQYIVATSSAIGEELKAVNFIGSIDNVSVKEVGQNWSLEGGWSVENGLLVNDGTGVNLSATQSGFFTVGNKYRVSLDIKSITQGSLEIYLGFPQSDVKTINSIGSYTYYIIATGNTTFYIKPLNNFIGSIDNVSVKEVAQNWSVANDDANNYVEFNQDEGTVRLKFLNTSPLTSLSSNTQYLSGKKYKLTVDVKEVVSGAIKIDAAGVSETFNSVGVQERIIEPTSNAFIIFYRATADVDITLNSVSLIEITDDTNLPRIDYTDGEGSLLLEPQSTNLITDSINGIYGSSPASEILTTAPDGTNTAVRPVPNSNSNRYQYTISGGTYATNSKLTYSWYRKRISTPVDTQYTGDLRLYILVNCTQVGSTTQIETDINGFDRFEAVFNITDGSQPTTIRGYFGFSIGIGNSSVAYWGHQLEALSYSTSLIPTNGSTVTRLADVCNNSSSSDLINSTEGVLYAEISALANDLTNRFISISNGSKAERVEIGYSNVSNKIFAFSNVGNVNQCNIGFVLPNMLDYNKIALKYKLNDFSLWVNGVKVGVDLNASVSAQNTLNELAFDEGDGTDVFYSKTKCVAVFKEALSDTELQKLTTI